MHKIYGGGEKYREDESRMHRPVMTNYYFETCVSRRALVSGKQL